MGDPLQDMDPELRREKALQHAPVTQEELERHKHRRKGPPAFVSAVLTNYASRRSQVQRSLNAAPELPSWASIALVALAVTVISGVVSYLVLGGSDQGVDIYSIAQLCSGHAGSGHEAVTINGVYCGDGAFHTWVGGHDNGECRLGAPC